MRKGGELRKRGHCGVAKAGERGMRAHCLYVWESRATMVDLRGIKEASRVRLGEIERWGVHLLGVLV